MSCCRSCSEDLEEGIRWGMLHEFVLYWYLWERITKQVRRSLSWCGVGRRNTDGLAITCGKESGSFWTHYMYYGSIVKARWVVTQEGL